MASNASYTTIFVSRISQGDVGYLRRIVAEDETSWTVERISVDFAPLPPPEKLLKAFWTISA